MGQSVFRRSPFSGPRLSRTSTSPRDCVQGRERLDSLLRIVSEGKEDLLPSLGSSDGGGAEPARRRGIRSQPVSWVDHGPRINHTPSAAAPTVHNARPLSAWSRLATGRSRAVPADRPDYPYSKSHPRRRSASWRRRRHPVDIELNQTNKRLVCQMEERPTRHTGLNVGCSMQRCQLLRPMLRSPRMSPVRIGREREL